MVVFFLSILADRRGRFPEKYLEQLYCREPVNAYFWKNELYSTYYLRRYPELWKHRGLKFVGLFFIKKELYYKALHGIFRNFKTYFKILVKNVFLVALQPVDLGTRRHMIKFCKHHIILILLY